MYPERKFDPKARNAIVTGSTRRVGLEIAKALIDDGWNVVIHGRNKAQVLDVQHQIGAIGAIEGDLCFQDTYEAFDKACEVFFDGKLGLLVNNAATFITDGQDLNDRWHGFSASLWPAHWAYCLTFELAKHLNRAGGLVVNITDLANPEGWDNFVAHGGAKVMIEEMGIHMNRVLPVGRRGMAVVGMRLPTVLPPDHFEDEDVKRLVEAHGEMLPVEAVGQGILQLTRANRFGRVAELHTEGKMTWVQ